MSGAPFTAEGTLARYRVGDAMLHTLILRNVEERLAAERASTWCRPRRTTCASRRESAAATRPAASSAPAPPCAERWRTPPASRPPASTVLLFGETGIGKELFARGIREASPRRDRPLVCVNCAAIPESLIGSEFFGHERGGFTGATQRRRGRFSRPDGGTIFLDEVGELPLDMQASSCACRRMARSSPSAAARHRSVDVRVVAATNRDAVE